MLRHFHVSLFLNYYYCSRLKRGQNDYLQGRTRIAEKTCKKQKLFSIYSIKRRALVNNNFFLIPGLYVFLFSLEIQKCFPE